MSPSHGPFKCVNPFCTQRALLKCRQTGVSSKASNAAAASALRGAHTEMLQKTEDFLGWAMLLMYLHAFAHAAPSMQPALP